MPSKNKKKKGQAESTKQTLILNRLQNNDAFSPETAKSLKELGFTDSKKYERHLEMLEGKGIIKKEGKGDNLKIWANKDKIKPKKSSSTNNFILFWLASTVVIFFIVFVILKP